MSDLLGPTPCDSYVNGCAAWTRTAKNHHADERTGKPCSCALSIVVLVLDQWSSTSPDLKEMSLADFVVPVALSGNDAEAAVKIFGGERRLARVFLDDRPFIGTVWMRDDPVTGKLVLFRALYDSSD
jgi:hypothetical protein